MTTKIFDGGLHRQRSGSVVFGIDQSLTGFGITVFDPSTEAYMSWVLKSRQVGAKRLAEIDEFLDGIWEMHSIHKSFRVVDAAMEGYGYASQMAHKAGEVGGLVKLNLSKVGLYPIQVAPPSVKKYATGKGKNVSKQAMMKAARERWGADFDDDNAADSYVIARVAARKVEDDYQQELISKLFGNEHMYRETRPEK